MMSIKESFLDDLVRGSPDLLVSIWILDRIPIVFQSDALAYSKWRHQLAKGLEVDPSSLIITGSAAFGVSLNPYKNFKEFDDASDIDIAVISDYHFTAAWRHMRRLGSEIHGLPEDVKRAIKEHVNRYIYWGTIATDKILALLPFGKTWRAALDRMAKLSPLEGRTLNARIYRDFESLRGYQAANMKNLQTEQLERITNVEIP